MRYDSLLNSKKWPSDSPKGSATPCFLPTLSVVLFWLLSDHPFSNLDFSGLGQSIFLKLDFVVCIWSKFNNWLTFSENITILIHLKQPQILCYFVALWVALASTKWPLHFRMVLSDCLEESKLPYLIWKGIFRAFIWLHLLKYLLVNKTCFGHIIPLKVEPLVLTN